jgi:hypothetical protein
VDECKPLMRGELERAVRNAELARQEAATAAAEAAARQSSDRAREDGAAADTGRTAAAEVGRCRLTASKPVFKARLDTVLETKMR